MSSRHSADVSAELAIYRVILGASRYIANPTRTPGAEAMTLEKWIIHPARRASSTSRPSARSRSASSAARSTSSPTTSPAPASKCTASPSRTSASRSTGDAVEIDHPQLRWDNFLEVFRNFGASGPKAEISVAVPRSVALTLGVVSASALVSGIRNDARLNTVLGRHHRRRPHRRPHRQRRLGRRAGARARRRPRRQQRLGRRRGHRLAAQGDDRHRLGRDARRLERRPAQPSPSTP